MFGKTDKLSGVVAHNLCHLFIGPFESWVVNREDNSLVDARLFSSTQSDLGIGKGAPGSTHCFSFSHVTVGVDDETRFVFLAFGLGSNCSHQGKGASESHPTLQ